MSSDEQSMLSSLAEYGADVQSAMERMLDDEEFYKRCLSLFVEDKSFEMLGSAIQAGDYKRAFNAAHTLKGVSANLGLTPLHRVVCEIVEALRANQHERLSEQYAAVMSACDEVKSLLAGHL